MQLMRILTCFGINLDSEDSKILFLVELLHNISELLFNVIFQASPLCCVWFLAHDENDFEDRRPRSRCFEIFAGDSQDRIVSGYVKFCWKFSLRAVMSALRFLFK